MNKFPSSNEEFDIDVDTCPSGCISTDTCGLRNHIEALGKSSLNLADASQRDAIKMMLAVDGSVTALNIRREFQEKTRQALLASCALWRAHDR